MTERSEAVLQRGGTIPVSRDDSTGPPSIAAAIAAARPGDRVVVRPGVYTERLHLTSDVDLVAADGRGTVVLHAAGGTAVFSAGDAVRLHGITILGGGGDYPAVQVGSGTLTLTGCDVRAAGAVGVHAPAGRLELADCTVTNPAGVGLFVEGDAVGGATRVTVHDTAGASVVIAGRAGVDLRGCVFSGTGRPGILCTATGRGTVTDCDLSGVAGAAIAVEEHGTLRVVGCTVHDTTDPATPLLGRLDELVGLARVKHEVATLVGLHRIGQRRAAMGRPRPSLSRHMVFAGAPGTGKSTVARLYARVLAALGALPDGHLVEVGPADLVTGPPVRWFSAALGGVLLVDELYALTPPHVRRDAVDALVALMDDHPDTIVVILAGNPVELERFLAADAALRTRFTRRIPFENFTADEMTAVFVAMAAAGGYECAGDTLVALRTHFESAPVGNGWYARQLLDASVRRQSARLRGRTTPTPDDLRTLLVEDVIAWLVAAPA